MARCEQIPIQSEPIINETTADSSVNNNFEIQYILNIRVKVPTCRNLKAIG